MSQISPVQQVVVAIVGTLSTYRSDDSLVTGNQGLCALKFRPPAQSIQGLIPTLNTCKLKMTTHPAYVLDLQTSFSPDDKIGHIDDDPWRSRALELERKLHDVSSRSESEHIGSDLLMTVKLPASCAD